MHMPDGHSRGLKETLHVSHCLPHRFESLQHSLGPNQSPSSSLNVCCGACAGLMYFAPSEKAKAVLNDWHQTCVEAGSNNQPAWNKVFDRSRRNSMDYHVMTKELYPHGYLLEQRGFFANDQQVCPLPEQTDHPLPLLLSS